MSKLLTLLCLLLLLCSGCSQAPRPAKDITSTKPAAASSSGSKTVANKQPAATSPVDSKAMAAGETTDDYIYNLQEDRVKYQLEDVDITVGDKLYMTQINDWFKNFDDYANKTVCIEGYYLHFDNKYTFVGRKGPTCPYCVGGYVDFEFKSDQDMSQWETGVTWIQVKGIVRAGRYLNKNGKPLQPFYYIEALQVKKLPQAGLGTITN